MYNAPTIPLLSPYYPPTMVRLNSAQRNECINWRAAWLNRQKAYSEADRSSNARKEKAKEKKEPKKEKEKEKERVRYSRTSYSARAHTGTGGLSLLLYLIIEQIRKNPNDLQRIANERRALYDRIRRL